MYVKDNDSGATPSPYVLETATGNVAPLGAATGSGNLTVQSGATSTGDGTLILSNSQGTVTIHLSGTEVSAGMLSTLTYSVVSGTGAYASATGSGTVQLEFGGPLLLIDPGPGNPSGGREGSYALTFGDATPPPLS
jgi:hypothetical protein